MYFGAFTYSVRLTAFLSYSRNYFFNFKRVMKVLIIDDNPKMRTFIRQVLTETSTEIYECTDGQWALQAYREYRPDWVFMDIKMNLKDGITATREIH